jgi:hypothetical protein
MEISNIGYDRVVKVGNLNIYVLAGSDLNPRYRSCVYSFRKFWQSMNSVPGFTFWPQVISISQSIEDDFGDIRFRSSSDIPNAFAAQITRLILPGTQEADLVMTSDIDMVPLNPLYFTTAAHLAISKDSFVVMRKLGIPDEYPICYLMASPENWRKVINQNFDSQLSVSEITRLILRRYEETDPYSGIRGGSGWSIDQKFIFEMLSKSKVVNMIEQMDSETGFRRLDRIHHNGIKKWLSLFLILQRSFTDYHLHLPVEKNLRFLRCALTAVKLGNLPYIWKRGYLSKFKLTIKN